MPSAALGRIRAVIGARLRLLQARYDAAANAMELRPSIDRLESTWGEWRAQDHNEKLAQRSEVAELRDAVAQLAQRNEVAELHEAVAQLQALQTKQFRLSRAEYDDIGGLRQKLIALRRSGAYAATFEN
jgi:hypothetical protein